MLTFYTIVFPIINGWQMMYCWISRNTALSNSHRWRLKMLELWFYFNWHQHRLVCHEETRFSASGMEPKPEPQSVWRHSEFLVHIPVSYRHVTYEMSLNCLWVSIWVWAWARPAAHRHLTAVLTQCVPTTLWAVWFFCRASSSQNRPLCLLAICLVIILQ